MNDLGFRQNPYGDDKVIDSCGLFGVMNQDGSLISGHDVIRAMENMHDRGNGLGGGFSAYGIYPDYAELYAIHCMFDSRQARETTESFLQNHFQIVQEGEIPHRRTEGVVTPPILWRYFVEPRGLNGTPPDDYVVEKVMFINTEIPQAFVFSSGKDMGVFKGVGHTEDIGRFFLLQEYQGYLWTAHSRFPTNTQGWWGGAHPFSILDWTVVHNGEISSYGINRRHLEMYDYFCTMHTDTEVMAYAIDLLIRRHGLSVEEAAKVLAPPLWTDIEAMAPAEREFHLKLRQVYGSLLMNGPFTVIIAHRGEMIGLGDRVRLRPLVAATKGSTLFLSSEEAAIRLISPEVDRTWIPKGGEPVIGRLGSGSVASAGQPRAQAAWEGHLL